ncbi:Putative rRNA methyltransferase 3 [Mycobacterium intracellulare subsp. intracellulare MTCC 9506]|uniref:Putative rRNA methyltransferase 3 n=1 Tax=Mycobacterium indicus pranii (strain DSM 45239 / MTCC 9506) TaxID=1232724 RepID=J9WB47_MYCIP|nr:Putative rRNA methyltransferase 3 [Mycobacterium intracellulare subsp. intracellulare MTCC 9506]
MPGQRTAAAAYRGVREPCGLAMAPAESGCQTAGVLDDVRRFDVDEA